MKTYASGKSAEWILAGLALATVVLAADPALAQGAGTMPTGRLGQVIIGVITVAAIGLGVAVVAFGIIKGGYELSLGNNGGFGGIAKAILVGGFIASALAVAVWAVGSSMSAATIPGLSSF